MIQIDHTSIYTYLTNKHLFNWIKIDLMFLVYIIIFVIEMVDKDKIKMFSK